MNGMNGYVPPNLYTEVLIHSVMVLGAVERGFGHEGSSLVAQMVKNLPAMWETWVQSLGWEEPLEEGMAIHSSVLTWRIPWTEEPGGL